GMFFGNLYAQVMNEILRDSAPNNNLSRKRIINNMKALLQKTTRRLLMTVLILSLGMQYKVIAQGGVGIGTTNPDKSAILDLSSSEKGLLLPRLSLQQRTSIENPANGLMVYQTDMMSG